MRYSKFKDGGRKESSFGGESYPLLYSLLAFFEQCEIYFFLRTWRIECFLDTDKKQISTSRLFLKKLNHNYLVKKMNEGTFKIKITFLQNS